MMGSRAKIRARQREAVRQSARAIRQMHDETEATSEYQAEVAATQDAGTRRLISAALPQQEERLRRARWRQTVRAADGAGMWDQMSRGIRLIHSVGREKDGEIWAHVSVSARNNTLPGWYEVRDAQWLLYPGHAGLNHRRAGGPACEYQQRRARLDVPHQGRRAGLPSPGDDLMAP